MSLLQLLYLAMALLWAGTAVYLRGLMVAARPMDVSDRPRAAQARRRLRWVFLGVATPAALVTLASGEALHRPLVNPAGLVAYLAVVGLLFWAHGAYGLLVLKLERGQYRGLVQACRFLSGLTIVLLLLFTGMVLLQTG
ncbi:hypothetical protein [Hydrogenophaga laconesensis]|uniref:Membrane protein n=1 Tax=Hydrogenophaga laconesensis TaxID=1805971 RepID=A0ABU1VBP7_9BURK|nr:hypothetical protein [Hydrogenophaga laconesensis]MDR7094633.1 putative membrane protein [Hydrogenophaga laconesensis]